MFCHREVIVCFDGYDLISIGAEAVEVDAEGLRIAADIHDLINAISADHCHSFVVDAYAWRIDDDHIRLLRNSVELLLDISADIMAVGDAVKFCIGTGGFNRVFNDINTVNILRSACHQL